MEPEFWDWLKMLPNIDPRAMSMAMKKLGIKQTDIPAKEVIIKTEDEDIIIKEPSVSKIDMMGKISFQITGDTSIQSKSLQSEVTKEDINTVIQHTNCSEEQAINALKATNGDMAEAILKLKK